MPEQIYLSRARRVAYFAGHEINVIYRTRIADSERRIEDRPVNRTPDIDDAVAADCSSGARISKHLAKPCAAGLFRIIVVDSTGGRRPGAVAVTTERERRPSCFPFAHEMIEHIAALGAGDSTSQFSRLFVIHVQYFGF